MFFVLLVSVIFSTNPYLPYIGGQCRWAVSVGKEEFKWCQPAHHYGASKDLILVHIVQLKSMIKAHSSGRMVSSGIFNVVIASVYSEKTV